MTHPLVSAFHRLKTLADRFNAGRGVHASDSPFFKDIFFEASRLDKLVTEVMASIPSVKCYVGFYAGANNHVMFVWLWPLMYAHGEEIHYWYWGPNEYECFDYDDALHPRKVSRPYLCE